MMALSLVTPPGDEPLSIEEAKAHLRIDTTDDDLQVESLIVAAREYCESYTHRAFISQTWDLKLDGFPAGDLWLPLPPVSSVTSVTYVDVNGVTQTWPTSQYLTDLPAGPKARAARITPQYMLIYPMTRQIMASVTVRFVCGYGTSPGTLPGAIRAAMLLLIGNWWTNREAGELIRASADVLPFGVDALLWPYKAF
jgi:uncharacterized phiE125 gp8 family phage protein